MISLQQESDLLVQLVGKRLDRLTAPELSRKAHWRWDREEFIQAAVLFAAAASKSAEESRVNPTARNPTMSYRARAGVTFRRAGEIERAWPLLLEATTYDWAAAGIPEDSHFTEWAFVEMLIVYSDASDAREFSRTYWQAVKRGEELEWEFPHIHRKQELLLALCASLGLTTELAHVIQRIEAQRGHSRKVTRLLAPYQVPLQCRRSGTGQ